MKPLKDYSVIDIHYHADPDLYQRRLDAMAAGQSYHALDAAVVLKSHIGSTGIQAGLCQNQGLPVLPSLVLNAVAGGVDYRVVIRALAEYKPQIAGNMIVHFPSITGRHFQSRLPRQLAHPGLSQYTLSPETLFDTDRRLKPQAIDVLKLARDYPVVLSTGHACRAETYALIDACIQFNIPALLLNQPAHPLMGLQAKELAEIAQNRFVWIEQTILTYLLGHQSRDDFAEVLRSVPNVIYSSDLGQQNQMDIPGWFTYSAQLFTELGLSPERKDAICRSNALQMLTPA